MRVGLVQHKIALDTSSPLNDQREAIFQKITEFIKIAAECGVNVLCLQEAWS